MRHLEPGHRVFAYVATAGYVGIGRVTGTMILAREVEVDCDGKPRPLLDLPLFDYPDKDGAAWRHRAASEDPERTEKVVPVEWLADPRRTDQAVWEKGLFANSWTVCRMRDAYTIRAVESAFGLDPAAG